MPRLTSFLPPILLLNEFDGVGSLLVDLTGPGLSHLDLAGAILSCEDMQPVRGHAILQCFSAFRSAVAFTSPRFRRRKARALSLSHHLISDGVGARIWPAFRAEQASH